jgi:hypothetical protein
MTIDADVKKLMKGYRFVPKNEKKHVYDALYHTIQNFDILFTITFEFQAGDYDRVITDILAKAKSVDEVIKINNEVVEMFKLCADLCEIAKSTRKAHLKLKRVMKDFMAKYNVSGGNFAFDGSSTLDEALHTILGDTVYR